jgi:hypothetical protein
MIHYGNGTVPESFRQHIFIKLSQVGSGSGRIPNYRYWSSGFGSAIQESGSADPKYYLWTRKTGKDRKQPEFQILHCSSHCNWCTVVTTVLYECSTSHEISHFISRLSEPSCAPQS